MPPFDDLDDPFPVAHLAGARSVSSMASEVDGEGASDAWPVRSKSGIQPGGAALQPRRYEPIELLACGGMGSVHLAAEVRGEEFIRLVALKRPHPRFDDEEAHAQARVEAWFTARVVHPNVVSLYEVVEEADGPTLVLGYVDGVSLRELTPRDGVPAPPLPVDVALRLVMDILYGLHAIHEIRDEGGRRIDVLHRDVSPGNVLVGVDGMGRLGDLGLACELATVRHGRRTVVQGTPRYLSPEQARGEPLARASDLYAVGLILLEMLTGRPTYEGRRASQVIRDIAKGTGALDVLEAAQLGATLTSLCRVALDPDVRHRYPDALTFARHVRRVARREGVRLCHDEVARLVGERFRLRIERQRARVEEWLHSLRLRAPFADDKTYAF